MTANSERKAGFGLIEATGGLMPAAIAGRGKVTFTRVSDNLEADARTVDVDTEVVEQFANDLLRIAEAAKALGSQTFVTPFRLYANESGQWEVTVLDEYSLLTSTDPAPAKALYDRLCDAYRYWRLEASGSVEPPW